MYACGAAKGHVCRVRDCRRGCASVPPPQGTRPDSPCTRRAGEQEQRVDLPTTAPHGPAATPRPYNMESGGRLDPPVGRCWGRTRLMSSMVSLTCSRPTLSSTIPPPSSTHHQPQRCQQRHTQTARQNAAEQPAQGGRGLAPAPGRRPCAPLRRGPAPVGQEGAPPGSSPKRPRCPSTIKLPTIPPPHQGRETHSRASRPPNPLPCAQVSAECSAPAPESSAASTSEPSTSGSAPKRYNLIDRRQLLAGAGASSGMSVAQNLLGCPLCAASLQQFGAAGAASAGAAAVGAAVAPAARAEAWSYGGFARPALWVRCGSSLGPGGCGPVCAEGAHHTCPRFSPSLRPCSPTPAGPDETARGKPRGALGLRDDRLVPSRLQEGAGGLWVAAFDYALATHTEAEC